MILYHMSQTLILGEEMKNDFEKKSELTLPFVYALEKSIDSFCDWWPTVNLNRQYPTN